MSGESNQTGSADIASEGEQGQRQFATLDDVQRLVDASLRRSQSMKDKSESRLAAMVQERTKAIEDSIRELRESGQNVPDGVEQKLKDEAYAESVRSHAGSSPTADVAAYLRHGAEEIYREYGVVIDPNNAEDAAYTAMVDANAPSPKKFLEQLEAAAKAKAADKGVKMTDQKPESRPTGSGIPSLGGGAGSSPKPAANLEAQYKNELAEAMRNPLYSREQGAKIRKKYRDQGLPI